MASNPSVLSNLLTRKLVVVTCKIRALYLEYQNRYHIYNIFSLVISPQSY